MRHMASPVTSKPRFNDQITMSPALSY